MMIFLILLTIFSVITTLLAWGAIDSLKNLTNMQAIEISHLKSDLQAANTQVQMNNSDFENMKAVYTGAINELNRTVFPERQNPEQGIDDDHD